MRKSLLLYCFALLFLLGCKKDSVNVPGIGSGASLAVLRVEYAGNHSFKGGKVFHYPTYASVEKKIPVSVEYSALGSLGNVSLLYQPTNDTFFNGTIASEGLGKIRSPKFDDRSAFPVNNTSVAFPLFNDIQMLTNPGVYSESFFKVAHLWAAIGNLDITRQFAERDAKVGIFLYTPSNNVADSLDWEWHWILYVEK